MARATLALAATFAVTATSFLLPPPPVSELDIADAWKDIDVRPINTLVPVPCTGCLLDSDGDETSLLLNFSVRGEFGTLELGGKPVYPPLNFLISDPSEHPTALAVPLDHASESQFPPAEGDFPRLSISDMSILSHESRTILPSGVELLTVVLKIQAVEGRSVEVPDIHVNINKQPDGSLQMGTVVYKLFEAGSSCQSPLCKFRQFVEDKMGGRPNFGLGIGSGRPNFGDSGRPKMGHGRPCKGKGKGWPKPHPLGHHHEHPVGEHDSPSVVRIGKPTLHHSGHATSHHGHHHHKCHRMMRHVGRMIMALLVPFSIGLAAGGVTYAILGCGILLLARYRRNRQGGYGSVALDEEDATAKEAELEGEPRESFESAPPVYEHAPDYEEKQVA